MIKPNQHVLVIGSSGMLGNAVTKQRPLCLVARSAMPAQEGW
jgi:hypothetical protein